MPALSISDVPQVCDPDYHESRRPSTRAKSTMPARPTTTSRPATVSRPHTVGASRPRTRSITTARTWYYGKPPPKEAHAAVIDWNKARQIKAPIMRRRARSSSACGKENNERTEVSVLQPYPLNYNAFLVQTLKKDMGTLYSVPPDLIIRPSKSSHGSDQSSSDDEVSIAGYCNQWKMT
ncbi:hypothetical protein ACHWQZ_G005430 [Mnemiopsis leidyi]